MGDSPTRSGIWLTATLIAALIVAGCGAENRAGSGAELPVSVTAADNQLSSRTAATTQVEIEPLASDIEPATNSVAVSGTVYSAVDGAALAGVSVTADGVSTITDSDGRFELDAAVESTITISKPGWSSTTVDASKMSGESDQQNVDLEPFTVRGLRVSGEVAADSDRFDRLLEMADNSVVNTLVFDTKDEGDRVLYESNVELAQTMGAIEALYDPAELLTKTRRRGLYTVTRIVTFEDGLWSEAVPDARLAADWVDAGDRANWEYPLDLAVEACQLGFDEVQFDYVRYPEGRAAEQARDLGRIPATSEARAATIGAFLTEARARLAPLQCAVSAAVFGVIMSSPNDEGIGQTVETVSAAVDTLSPMIYPSHYGPGWIGFEDPNEHPGPVVAHALDGGIPRLAANTLLRPWLQAFEYRPDQVKAQISEVEQRGGGWILWNFYGRYNEDALPTESGS